MHTPVTCRFTENLTLASLIAPVSETEFRENFWEQKPLVVHRDDRGYYSDLFTLQHFDEAIARNPAYIKIGNAAAQKNEFIPLSEISGLERVLAEMRDGGTLVLDRMHERDPRLKMLCQQLASELGHGFQTNLYLTPPNGKGFSPHWDGHDVFILQVLGFKHWKVETERRAFPKKMEQMSEEGRAFQGNVRPFTLSQGDVAYIPRGYVHAAECGAEPSLHITLGVNAVFFEDFLHSAVQGAAKQNENLRATLPFGFMNLPTDDLVARAKAALEAISDGELLKAVFDEFKDRNVRKFPLDVSGQVADFFRAEPLALDDVVGSPPGLVYTKHDEREAVRLNFGTRSITFPEFFGAALDFALRNRSFAIRDLPGDLEDVERVVFAERLIQEGLIVRKRTRHTKAVPR